MNDPNRIKLVSIELTRRCQKGCPWCYAAAKPDGPTFWMPDMLVKLLKDLFVNGIEAVSFGGGEPLEYPYILTLLDELLGIPLFLSMTTNGLLLDERIMRILAKRLNKIHISIHFPENLQEVHRVIWQVHELTSLGVKAGINMVVKGENPEADRRAAELIRDAGIKPPQVVLLPLRGPGRTINSDAVKAVGPIIGAKWQSMWCLLQCRSSERFVSIDWEGKASYCSYTSAKTKMEEFTYASMVKALRSKDLIFCGAELPQKTSALIEL